MNLKFQSDYINKRLELPIIAKKAPNKNAADGFTVVHNCPATVLATRVVSPTTVAYHPTALALRCGVTKSTANALPTLR